MSLSSKQITFRIFPTSGNFEVASVTIVSGLVTTGLAWQWTGMRLPLCDSYTAEMSTDISLRGTSYGCRGVNPSVVLFLKSGQPTY